MSPKPFSTLLCLFVTVITLLWQEQSYATDLRIPDLTLPTINGRQLNFSELKGRPVLIQFWATTCNQCQQEIPELITLYEDMQTYELEIIAIPMPYDPPNRVLKTARDRQITYPVALDIEGKAAQALGNVSVTPTSFLIDVKGNVVSHHTGKQDFKQLRQAIRKIATNNNSEVIRLTDYALD